MAPLAKDTRHPLPQTVRAASVFFLLVFYVLCSGISLVSWPFVAHSESSSSSKSSSGEGSESKKKTRESKKRKKKGETEHSLKTVPSQVFETASSKINEVDAILILDGSGSMLRTDPNRLRDQGAKLFARFLGPSDRLAIMEFDREQELLLDFVAVTPNVQPSIDEAIEKAAVNGRYTNLYAPLADALVLLQSKGRPSAEKCVVLLSDGKMDPHPDSGTPDELTEKLMRELLPQYRKSTVKLYTLALSSEADDRGLANIAQATGAMHWFAPDVNSIHLKFSDLFLTLKRPQVVALEGQNFEIDSRIEEATFYISRNDPNRDVNLMDPQRNIISAMHLPPNVKWYRGSLFDLITIAGPIPGSWTVSGIDSFSGHTTLITDLELQLSWPKQNFEEGEKVKFFARLVGEKQILNKPGLKDVTFYTFKIVDAASGENIYSGSLVDDGLNGDEQAGDGIYTGNAALSRSGELKAVISANSQTFVRQQHQPFSVRENLLTLELKPEDTFVNKPERFVVALSKQGVALGKREVELIARNSASGEETVLKIEHAAEKDGDYELDSGSLPNGKYAITAVLRGIDTTKKAVRAESNILEFELTRKRVLTPEEKDAEQRKLDAVWWGIASLSLGFVWFLGLGGVLFYRIKAASRGEVGVKAYRIPFDMEEILGALESRELPLVRKPEVWEREMYECVENVFKSPPEGKTLVEINYKEFSAIAQAGGKR